MINNGSKKFLPPFLRLSNTKIALVISVFFALIILLISGNDYPFQNPFLNKCSRIFRTFEYRAFDQKFFSRGKRTPPKNVAIVAMDEKSVTKIGRWPWPRSKMAELIQILHNMGAKSIALDIVFSEPDRLGVYGFINEAIYRLKREISLEKGKGESSQKFLEYLETEKERVNADRILGATIQKTGNVVLGFFFLTDQEIIGLKKEQYNNFSTLEDSKISVILGARNIDQAKKNLDFELYQGVRSNISEIARSNSIQGFFNTVPEIDGIHRRTPLLIGMNGELYPSLSLQAVRMYYRQDEGMGNIIPVFNPTDHSLKSIKYNAPHNILADSNGWIYYNWYGEAETIPTFSIIDILQGKIKEENIRGKIIIVGPTALAIADLRTTPFGGRFPGVEMQATLVGNILENNYLVRNKNTLFFEILLVLLLGTSLGFLIGRLKPIWGFLCTVFVLSSLIVLDHFIIFQKYHIWVRSFWPFLALLIVYMGVTLRGFIAEQLERRKIKQTFNVYVNPSVVDQMLQHPDKFRLGGERKELSVFFSDIRGFTTISEKLDPQDLVHFLNEYLTPMTEIILSYNGTLDKYIGDAIMGFWGAPIEQPNHAHLACRSALDMIEKLENLQIDWEKRNLPKIEIGIGINTGLMSVGNMGSENRFNYTVVGDEVNLSSRLEGLCKEYGSRIILGKKTAQRVKNEFIVRLLDRVKVKGKSQGEEIYELLARRTKGNGSDSEITLLIEISEKFENGLIHYWNRDWENAQKCFEEVIELKKEDRPSRLFLEQIEKFRNKAPEPDWDGFRTMERK